YTNRSTEIEKPSATVLNIFARFSCIHEQCVPTTSFSIRTFLKLTSTHRPQHRTNEWVHFSVGCNRSTGTVILFLFRKKVTRTAWTMKPSTGISLHLRSSPYSQPVN
ncbi:unnamed protein product, partial [Ectocarpus sp. 12 AP-2014]